MQQLIEVLPVEELVNIVVDYNTIKIYEYC